MNISLNMLPLMVFFTTNGIRAMREIVFELFNINNGSQLNHKSYA